MYLKCAECSRIISTINFKAACLFVMKVLSIQLSIADIMLMLL